jgi:hypothetical protein
MSTRTRSASQQDSNTLWREKLVIGHDPDRSARCRRWVKRVALGVDRPLPVNRDQRTLSGSGNGDLQHLREMTLRSA